MFNPKEKVGTSTYARASGLSPLSSTQCRCCLSGNLPCNLFRSLHLIRSSKFLDTHLQYAPRHPTSHSLSRLLFHDTLNTHCLDAQIKARGDGESEFRRTMGQKALASHPGQISDVTFVTVLTDHGDTVFLQH